MTNDTQKLLDLINQSSERDQAFFIGAIEARLDDPQLPSEDLKALENVLQQIKTQGTPPTFPGSSASRGY